MNKERIFYLFDLKNPENDVNIKVNNCINETEIISDLGEILCYVDESNTFSSTVLYYFKTKHLTTKDLYDRAYIDRRLFHKIVRKPKYHPSKKTVLALCIAFELNYPESVDLLGLASYSFASNSRSDMIFSYFISKMIYDLDLINSVLYHFKCPCIGD